jgi:hypothetical protein
MHRVRQSPICDRYHSRCDRYVIGAFFVDGALCLGVFDSLPYVIDTILSVIDAFFVDGALCHDGALDL